MSTHQPQLNLVEALCATRGVVCLVGAGGKKTTAYRLAMEHRGRVGVTSTVAIAPFPATLTATNIVATDDRITAAVVQAARYARRVAFALPSAKRERLGGLSCTRIMRIHDAARFDVTLVKSDGARGRLIKAPGSDEPVIPDGAVTVIPVVSARAFGKPLSDQIAHRIDYISAITGARAGDLITPGHVARLLTSAEGALKNASNATVVPVINMVDNEKLKIVAREAAEFALDSSDRFQHVVLTSMRRAQPVMDIVSR